MHCASRPLSVCLAYQHCPPAHLQGPRKLAKKRSAKFAVFFNNHLGPWQEGTLWRFNQASAARKERGLTDHRLRFQTTH